jgi:PIN domain nuclease of toxin-antitoxin system
MRLLLDTHCWLWLQTAPERFSEQTLGLLADDVNELLLSAASSWEITIKYALGRLPLPDPPTVYVPSRMVESGTVGLPIEHTHALRVSLLPNHHRDPFDRLIIAQAQCENLTIVTSDADISRYDVNILAP